MPTVETVTVLITDLVGSTGLAARIGPVAADDLRREHFATLRKAIESCGGNEVKNIGDGLMIVFAGAANAVECAVSIQQAVERRNRGALEQLAIREGVALGDVTCEDGDYFGMPVVQAARLCDKAAGGQILATDVVRMIDGREEHSFASVGPMELRGFPEAIPVYEVRWEQPGGWNADVPLPPRLRGVPPVGYVGRLKEQACASECWESACEGQRSVLLIAGEPGIGKTRFSTHAALEFHGEGAAVLYGHCEQDLGLPYGAWVQALSHLVEHLPDDALAAYVEHHGGDLKRLIPALGRRVPDAPDPARTDPETERYLLFSAVVGLLEQSSAESPVVLVLDDLHWADRPTLALLRYVVAEAHALRLLVLGNYRDSDLSRDHPLVDVLADLRRENGVERLILKGLDEHDVVTLHGSDRRPRHGPRGRSSRARDHFRDRREPVLRRRDPPPPLGVGRPRPRTGRRLEAAEGVRRARPAAERARGRRPPCEPACQGLPLGSELRRRHRSRLRPRAPPPPGSKRTRTR